MFATSVCFAKSKYTAFLAASFKTLLKDPSFVKMSNTQRFQKIGKMWHAQKPKA